MNTMLGLSKTTKENTMHLNLKQQWLPYLQRYKNGEYRAVIFRDIILADIHKLGQLSRGLSLLDIGCGNGFDNDPGLQLSLSKSNNLIQYIGIEPDINVKLQDIYTTTYRCNFEDAPIEPNSVDISFAVMVLEHFPEPEIFWHKIYTVLKKGGVFWGFTVNAHHWFVTVSTLAGKLHIKDWYLNKIHGKRGEERYQNYAVYYRANTHNKIQKYTQHFTSTDILNFKGVGQMDFYYPKKFIWVGRTLDRIGNFLGFPGIILAVRVEK